MRLIVWILVATGVSVVSAAESPVLDSASLKERLQAVQAEVRLVGIGATVLVDGKVLAEAVVGRRRAGADQPLTVSDHWHLGSITKSMTATVIGRLIEQGRLSLDERLSSLLPEMATAWDDGWNEVILHQLLTHTSGIPANFPMATQFVRTTNADDLHDARRIALAAVLSKPPLSTPGETFLYSNIGYTLAGFIAAERAGTAWETLMRQELFSPLKLDSAGFGPPGENAPENQPWGHQRVFGIRTAMDPSKSADNSPVIGPAGTIHMSMNDLARYGWEHLRGETEDTGFLQAATFQKLHAGGVANYACGWLDWQREWADGRILWHNGTNTLWYALIAIVPSRSAVVVIVTNEGHLVGAPEAFMKLTETLIRDLPVRP